MPHCPRQESSHDTITLHDQKLILRTGIFVNKHTCICKKQAKSRSIPSRFMDMSTPAPMAGTCPQELFAEALTAPCIPPKKGAQKEICGKVAVAKKRRSDSLTNSYGKLSITHAKANPRSYIRCTSDNPSEHGLWTQVSAKTHPDHVRMIEIIAAKAVKDDLSCSEVKTFRGALLLSWPGLPQ